MDTITNMGQKYVCLYSVTATHCNTNDADATLGLMGLVLISHEIFETNLMNCSLAALGVIESLQMKYLSERNKNISAVKEIYR